MQYLQKERNCALCFRRQGSYRRITILSLKYSIMNQKKVKNNTKNEKLTRNALLTVSFKDGFEFIPRDYALVLNVINLLLQH